MIWGFIFSGSFVSEMVVTPEDGNSMGESPLCGERKGWQEPEILSKGLLGRDNESEVKWKGKIGALSFWELGD